MPGTFRKKLIRKLSAAGRARQKKHRRDPKAVAPAPESASQSVLPVNPVQTMLRAAGFAARKHRGQTRADNLTPYFSHVARVTLILSHVFGVEDEDTLTAALLHDTLEDTATDYDEIAALFGERVAGYVVLLTKNVMLPKKEREEDYAKRLSTAPEPVIIAKMADLYDNLSDRVHTPKLRKTAATAGKLLKMFATRLRSRTGLAAHAKLTLLLSEVKALQAAEAAESAVE